MQHLGAEAWSQRYEAGDTPWDLNQPTPWLAEWLSTLGPVRGRVLVPGCGGGHDAIALAQAGFDVVGLDFAEVALRRAERQAELAGVTLEWAQADWLDLAPVWHARFDLVFEHTCFCAIAPEDRPRYVSSAWQALKPGGKLVGVFFTHRRQGGPPFGVQPREVQRLFEPAFETVAFEPITCSIPARQGDEHGLVAIRREHRLVPRPVVEGASL